MSFPRVGVIGAGQLARMMAVPANNLGIEFTVLASSETDSANSVARYKVGDYSSFKDVLAFALIAMSYLRTRISTAICNSRIRKIWSQGLSTCGLIPIFTE